MIFFKLLYEFFMWDFLYPASSPPPHHPTSTVALHVKELYWEMWVMGWVSAVCKCNACTLLVFSHFRLQCFKFVEISCSRPPPPTIHNTPTTPNTHPRQHLTSPSARLCMIFRELNCLRSSVAHDS